MIEDVEDVLLAAQLAQALEQVRDTATLLAKKKDGALVALLAEEDVSPDGGSGIGLAVHMPAWLLKDVWDVFEQMVVVELHKLGVSCPA